jgi:hypothetical protein
MYVRLSASNTDHPHYYTDLDETRLRDAMFCRAIFILVPFSF